MLTTFVSIALMLSGLAGMLVAAGEIQSASRRIECWRRWRGVMTPIMYDEVDGLRRIRVLWSFGVAVSLFFLLLGVAVLAGWRM